MSKRTLPEITINILLFAGVFLFLLLSFPENRAEADDGYWYAALVRDAPIHSLYNPRFLLFLPFLKVIHNLLPQIEVYTLICGVSMVFASLSIILLRMILKRYTDLSGMVIFWTLLLVLFSYEFWRYAVESEVYMMAIFLVLACLYVQLDIFRNGYTNGKLIALILISSFTVLIYKPAFLAVFVALPVLLVLRKLYKKLVIFYGVSGILVLLGYYLTFLVYTLRPDSFWAHAMGGANDPKGNPLMAPVVVVSNFIATAWVFGVQELKAAVSSAFAHKVVQEELLTASQVGNGAYFLIAVCLILAILALIAIFISVMSFRKNKPGISALYGTMLLLTAIYSGFLMIMDPTSNEPWLMITIPLAILIGKYVFQPVYDSGKFWVVKGILFLLLLNNYLGGMGLLQNTDYDYNYRKSQWLNKNTTQSDLILSLGPMSFVRYLDYYSAAGVYNFEEQYRKGTLMLDTLDNFKGNIYLTEDMINPTRAIAFRSKITSEKLDSVYSSYNYKVVPVDSTMGFITYKLQKK